MIAIRVAIVISFIERYALIALSLISNVLLARLLNPEEIGIYSVSLAVISVAQVIREFGIGNFLIQEKNLTEDHIRTAFGFTLLIGVSLFSIMYFAAPFAGKFYGEDRMAQTLRISALNFLVLPFCTISRSLLARDMAFKSLMFVNLFSALIGFAATLSCAYSGFGANSMAIGSVTLNIMTGITSWLARKKIKLFLPGFSEWRVILNFGSRSSLAGIITSISMDMNDLVVGKVLGFGPVAIISRAQGLMNLFHRDIMGAVRNVALPAFAAKHRKNMDLEEVHVRSIALVTVVAWPFYGGMAIYALEALRLLFGNQWDNASPLVPVYCLAGAFSCLSGLIPSLLIAVGRINLATNADILLQPLRMLLIISAVMVFQSIEACAIAFCMSAIISMPVFYIFKGKAIENNIRRLLKVLLSSAFVTLMTLLVPLLHVVTFFDFSRKSPVPFYELMVVIPIAIIIWVISVRLFKHPLYEESWFKRYCIR